VQPFLELVKQMYSNLRGVVEKEFGAPGQPAKPKKEPTPPPKSATPRSPGKSNTPNPSATPNPAGSDMGININYQPTITPLLRSLYSPKVLTECPIAVVLIFQTYKDLQQPALSDFYPLVMDSIRIQPEPQRVAYEEAKARNEIFVGVADGIVNREIYTELIKSQVKVS
jgi:transformation/transcription domain-associated protein